MAWKDSSTERQNREQKTEVRKLLGKNTNTQRRFCGTFKNKCNEEKDELEEPYYFLKRKTEI